MTFLSRLADAYFYVATPSGWPRRTRRAFVLTLPLSAPLLLLWWLALPLGSALAFFLYMAALGVAWCAYPFIALGASIFSLWSRP